MKKNKNLSHLIIKKPSFLSLVIGLLVHSLGLNNSDRQIKQLKHIGGYKLLKKIKKENDYIDSMIGCYTKKGNKFFIKTLSAYKKDYINYFMISEWLVSNILYKALKSKKSQITTPKPIEIIISDEFVSLVYEFLDAKTLSSFSTGYQAKVFIQIINELKKISNLLKKDEIRLFPKRSVFFYLISFPYLSLLTFFRTGRNFKIVTKAFLMTLKMILLQRINTGLSLAHRDLKPHNIMINDSKIFLIDIGRMALTVPGYDLALLSLDPAHSDLSESVEIKLKTSISKFLKSYIAIQFADSNDSVGKKYWEFLKSEYGNTNLRKKDAI